MATEKGTINVQTENIFPIIKKFLYSDHEIFLRELVSNAVDATQKLHVLSNKGEVEGELGDTHIDVKLDAEKGTITISDRGIGMSIDEVKKYINEIALSGANEFLEQYQDGDKNIIGHFGLGFYSSFMVAEKVEIKTKSHRAADEGAHWVCKGDPKYSLKPLKSKKTRGTDIILHIAEDSKEFLDEARIEGILKKFCRFLPVEIKFKDEVVNNPNPIWNKKPSELSDEDYQNFYKELYPYGEAPLFWIHLNVDYPFNLTGILYFPKVTQSYEFTKNRIHLYSNQVFVTDQVENIVPEFLMYLHGVIDSPDIPLNVSRSYLQGDPNVKKITNHITKKVADKLASLFKKDREGFEQKWEHVNMFVKYGMLSEEKFNDKAMKFAMLETTAGTIQTLEEHKEAIAPNQTDKNEKVVMLYSSNPPEQGSYIKSAEDKGFQVLKLDAMIDNHWVNHLEAKMENVQFKRVDADVVDNLVETDDVAESVLSTEQEEQLQTLVKETIDNEQMNVQLKAMSPDDLPVTITKPEFIRRMKEMSAMSGNAGGLGMMPDTFNFVLNSNHPIATKLLEGKDATAQKEMVQQLYDIALIQQGMLKGEELSAFVKRSIDLMK